MNEGIAILTGAEAGESDSHGRYPFDSVHGKVLKRLKKYHKGSMQNT